MDTNPVAQSTTSNVSLLVIGAGMARTGTRSLKLALELLTGQPCYHMFELLQHHRDHIAEWREIFQRMSCRKEPKAGQLERIFTGYGAVTDLPGCAVYRELMKVYPNAKVILTTRDADKWLESIRATVRPKRPHLDGYLFGDIADRICHGKGFNSMTDLSFLAALGWDVDLAEDTQMREAFKRRNEEVKRMVPADRLLVFEVKDGWQPLCEFLGLPIPNQPFPHVNDTASIQENIAGAYRVLRLVQFGVMSTCVAVLAFAVRFGLKR